MSENEILLLYKEAPGELVVTLEDPTCRKLSHYDGGEAVLLGADDAETRVPALSVANARAVLLRCHLKKATVIIIAP